MAIDPQFNLKTGADTQLFFSREVTKAGDDLGKLKSQEGIYTYPFLTRSTGNSIKGTTESIESNELRSGRTKSAPRKGNSSVEGSLDVEWSPETFDDILEAVFRNKWKRWTSDTDSGSNLDGNVYREGYFSTKCGKSGSRKLLNTDGSGEGDALGLITVPEGCVVHELTCGTEDIKYSVLRKYGGVTGEDLYQEFTHMAVDTISMDISVGAIVTGSFGFMGANDAEMLNESAAKANFTPDRFLNEEITGKDFIDNLPLKSTSTDQFTAREGFLYLNGDIIEYATNLTFELSNGLERKYAIFVKNAISTTPLSLDITGNLTTYLVHGKSEIQFNDAVRDKDTEILFSLYDKQDPNFVYVFQVFKTKFTDHDASVSGADTLDLSFPYQSFEERAARVFRIALPKVRNLKVIDPNGAAKLVVYPNVACENSDIETLSAANVKAELNGVEHDLGLSEFVLDTNELSETYGLITATFTPLPETTDEQVLQIKVPWNGEAFTKSFDTSKAEPPAPPPAPSEVTGLSAVAGESDTEVVLSWTEPEDEIFDHTEVSCEPANGTLVTPENVVKGANGYTATGLSSGTEYTFTVKTVSNDGVKSTGVTTTFTT